MTLRRCYRELRAAFLDGRQRLSEDAVFQIQMALQTEKSGETLKQLGRLAELQRFVQDLVASKRLSRRKVNRIRLLVDERNSKAQFVDNCDPAPLSLGMVIFEAIIRPAIAGQSS
jgi:hypothetical protein